MGIAIRITAMAKGIAFIPPMAEPHIYTLILAKTYWKVYENSLRKAGNEGTAVEIWKLYTPLSFCYFYVKIRSEIVIKRLYFFWLM